jgi:hypothetical protein
MKTKIKVPKRTFVQPPQSVKSRAELSVATGPAFFGCDPLFDIFTDEALMSLSFEGSAPFLDWLGWERTNICVIKKAFINFVRAEPDGGEASEGWVADPCEEANSYQVDYCDFTLTEFARLRRKSPTRDITKADIDYCKASPRYRVDGTPIDDQLEYDFRLATEVLMQDLKRMVIDGNKTTDGQFDGLNRLIKTGYTDSDGSACPAMDSIIIDYNNNTVNSTSTTGVTWNGRAVLAQFNFFNILTDVVRHIRRRIQMAPALNAQRMLVGDMVLVLPATFAPCLLDAFNCWSFCDNDTELVNSAESRQNRNALNTGLYGAGHITIDGFEIPLMPYDWGLIESGATFTAYLLTGSVGNVKLLQGQYNDMDFAARKRPDKFASTDGGRLLNFQEDLKTCIVQYAEMQPRLLAWAPWAQARFENVVCTTPGGALSSDPWDTYFPYPNP